MAWLSALGCLVVSLPWVQDADFKGRPLPGIGSCTSALETPPGKLLPLPVGPEGEVGTVSHWICPCATKIVENKGGKVDKYVIVLSASH